MDDIDKRILYELSKNARVTHKQIARKIQSKEQVVAYRIKKLEKNVITKYVPVFALSKLGIFSAKIYLRLHGVDEDFYKSLKADWIAKCAGRWDLLLGFYVRDIMEFAKIKNELLKKYHKYIQDYDITYIEDGLVFDRDYLYKSTTRNEFEYGGDIDKITLDPLQLKIINEIKNNARYKVMDVARKLNVDPRTVMQKIKQMKGVLQGYTTFVNLKTIGYQLYKLCIYLQEYDQTDKLINFLKSNPHTIHLIKSLGSWEFEVEIEHNSIEYIHEYISEIKNTFPKLIKQIDLVTITDEIKLDFFPNTKLLSETN